MQSSSLPEKKSLIEAIRLAAGFGRRVAIVVPRRKGVKPLFREVENLAQPALVRFAYRTNGMERIIFRSGGQIRFFGSGDRIRGYSCDVLVANEAFTDDQMKGLLPAIATSEHRQVIRLGNSERE
ncbi:hypothetical protein [Glutamicibacter halophytocola]|uniref:Uncharacterized protein n=1 Tax=Glutamicibacter halophytocola TaxID=1933880 RepID=A0AA95BRB1_9MICC|nr:hypothetical protein [Glutamicibacter halophytocola]UUX60161.1 hypothetical protein NUH22_05995 [Glutamicibacter halophytocola]